MSTLFDLAQRICRGDSLPPPVARLIGFTLIRFPVGGYTNCVMLLYPYQTEEHWDEKSDADDCRKRR